MDFMAEYGSDSDDGANPSEESLQKLQPLPPSPPQAAITQQKNKSKQKRNLELSFLPTAIQEALMRGTSAADSDDDEPPIQQQRYKTETNSSSTSNTAPTIDKAVVKDDPLLRLLPPPKMTSMQQLDENDPFASHPSSSSQSKLNNQSQQNVQVTGGSKYDKIGTKADSETKVVHPMSSLQNKPIVTSALPVAPPVAIDWSQIQTHNVLSGHRIHHDNYHINEYSSTSNNDASSNAAANRKRKERELEMQIQSGDLSSLEGLPLQNIQRTNNQWDAASYMDRQHKEIEIMNQYTNNGTMKSIAQPSRQQNVKHQLSSLALRAAETEISMMEAKGQKGKSKSKTLSKYGW